MTTEKVTIGGATLYCGDCFDILPELDIVADAVITDPPFGISHCEWDKAPPFASLWKMFENRTKPEANFVLFGCGMFSVDLINSNYQWYRYDLIWEKSNKVGFLNANLMPLRNHEQILVFGRPGFMKSATYNPQKTLGGRKRAYISGGGTVYGSHHPNFHVSDGTLHPCSVLSFKSDMGKGHPTAKPVRLMEYLVATYSNTGNTIIDPFMGDPFMGSGTTGVACVKAGRTFVGIEQNRKYFDIACERIAKAVAEHKNQFPEIREMIERKQLFTEKETA
jgi:site-specific DNA-methyltransferase (adenine-specific)